MTLKPRGYHLLLLGEGPFGQRIDPAGHADLRESGAVTVEFAVEDPGLIGEAILNEEHHRG